MLVPRFGESFTREWDRKKILNLALSLERNHSDDWLSTFLRAPLREKAVSRFLTAIALNRKGRPEDALQAAKTAKRLFTRLGNTAGVARSEFEIVYSLQRQSKPKECLLRAAQLEHTLRYHHYHWLEAQFLLEEASCQGMLANFDSAWNDAVMAAQITVHYHYFSLSLRALGFEAALDTGEGRLRQAWSNDVEGLRRFWGGAFSSDREYQFFSDLEIASEQNSQWWLAAVAQNEILDLLPEITQPELVALAHFTSGKIHQSVSEPRQAEEEYRIAQQDFDHLPESSFTNLYRRYTSILRATLEAQDGHEREALQLLQQVKGSIPKTTTYTLRLAYWKAMAQVARRSNDSQREKTCLEELLRIASQGSSSLRSAADRWEWDREVGFAYRRLLALQLNGPHHPLQTFADWEIYRWQQAEPRQKLFSRMDQEQRIHTRLGQLHQSSLIVFALLDNQIVTWVADDRGVREYRNGVDLLLLKRVVIEFYHLCSDPRSPIQKVNSTGSRLYQMLLEPVQSELHGRRLLFVESDGMLGLVPWSALVMPDGRYFSDRYITVISPGMLYPAGAHKARSRRQALIVYPGAVDLNSMEYPPLPQAEAEARFVAERFTNSTFLRGPESDAKNIIDRISTADLFHFAGHAISRNYGGELLISRGREGDILSASRIARLHLRPDALIVLSACSTAAADNEAAQDPHGLIWAFLHAGAGRVLASRWNIDSSSTRTLLQDFYAALPQHEPETAFYGSQRTLKSSPATAHPYYWSSFAVFGSVN